MTCRSGRSALAAVAMPAISPPPPMATTRVSIAGCCASISSADRALAGDHGEVVERMDDGEAALLGELQAGDARVLEGVALEHDLGAEAARVLDLDARGEARHDDRRRDAHPLGVVRDRLRVVAGRDREHALGALRGASAAPSC